MQRCLSTPRKNLADRAKAASFDLMTEDGQVYWDESAYYLFSLDEIETRLEAPSIDLAALCHALVARVIDNDELLDRLCIPNHAWEVLRTSWRRSDPSLYGRFDLAYDGTGPAKLLEFNADTPTTLFEAAAFQWFWRDDMVAAGSLPPEADQFNSIHEALISALADIARRQQATNLHFACDMNSAEDRGFISYLADCARQAGLHTTALAMSDIGTTGAGPFVDLDGAPISLLFKLYPWEWMFEDEFMSAPSMAHTRFIEPPWRAILSNKGILPLLWEMAPGHPNLLESYFADTPEVRRLGDTFVRKPLHSREGSNVSLIRNGVVLEAAPGPYDDRRAVVQAFAPLRTFDGKTPVIGSWVIADSSCGIGIREDASRITRNASRFVPHIILN